MSAIKISVPSNGMYVHAIQLRMLKLNIILTTKLKIASLWLSLSVLHISAFIQLSQ